MVGAGQRSTIPQITTVTSHRTGGALVDDISSHSEKHHQLQCHSPREAIIPCQSCPGHCQVSAGPLSGHCYFIGITGANVVTLMGLLPREAT